MAVAGIEKNKACMTSNIMRDDFLNPSVLSIANSYVLSSTSVIIMEYITIASTMKRKKITVKRTVSS